MPTPHGLHMTLDGPPAEVRPVDDLFSWSREESRRVAAIEAAKAETRERITLCDKTLAETLEQREADEAADELAESRKAVLDANEEVRAAREKAKAARKELRKVAAHKERASLRKRLKALTEASDEVKDRVLKALEVGRVPPKEPPFRRDPTVRVPEEPAASSGDARQGRD